MPVLDVFNSDAFGVTSMTAKINAQPFTPGRLGQLGIFEEQSVSTTTVMLEEKGGVISMIPNTPRGAAGVQTAANKRTARSFVTTHLPQEEQIMADEVEGVRAFGSENMMESVQAKVNERLGVLARNLDATLEHLRVGAIKGTILDSDGSTVIYNLFTEFGVSAITEQDFDLDNASPGTGALKKKCSLVIRLIADELGASAYTGILGVCGDAFFDDLIAHSQAEEAYRRYQESALLRSSQVYDRFYFGGITFENYRGGVGGTPFVATDKCHFVPQGVPGLFPTYFAPANYVETVNTLGLPRYAKTALDSKFQKHVDIEGQSNPLPICTRPRVLIQAKRT